MYSPIHIERSSKFGNNYWEVYSPKIERNVRLFSDLEYDYWVLLEMSPEIEMFCERPKEIRKTYKGKLIKAMFDMWVKREDGEEQFAAINYSSANSERSALKLMIQQEWCTERQLTFMIQTEKHIRKNQILLSNMKTILPFVSHRINPVETDIYQVFRHLSNVKKHSILELEQQVNLNPLRIREAIYWLLYHGYINSNIDDTLIGPSLEVWTIGKKSFL